MLVGIVLLVVLMSVLLFELIGSDSELNMLRLMLVDVFDFFSV